MRSMLRALVTRLDIPLHLFSVPKDAIGYNKVSSFAFGRRYASKSSIPIPPIIVGLETSNEINMARQWVEAFRKTAIPREAVELSFSRSSGPGGQNVNKVNTKCTARCSLSTAWIPMWAKESLRRNPAYVASSDSLLVTSTLHRSQAQNVDDSLSKLHALIIAASMRGVTNETSEAQKERVRAFQRANNARRRKDKERRSKTKQSRKEGDWD